VPRSFDGIATQAVAGRERFKDVRFGQAFNTPQGLGDVFAGADTLETCGGALCAAPLYQPTTTSPGRWRPMTSTALQW
jgi:hypothetical protein